MVNGLFSPFVADFLMSKKHVQLEMNNNFCFS